MELWVRKMVPWILLIWMASSTVAIARPCCQDLGDTICHGASSQISHRPVIDPFDRHHLLSKTISHHTYCELLQARQIQYADEAQLSTTKSQPEISETHFIANITSSFKTSHRRFQSVFPFSSGPRLYLTTSRIRV